MEDTSRRVRAKLAGCRLPPVLGHADWEAQNMRWLRGEPIAFHDWDSLAWLPEAALVSAAAGVFASHDKPTLAPVESSAAFLDAYERARRKRFSPDEDEIAWVASIWVALNDARDELIFNRPRLSYERLQAQRLERLARAHAKRARKLARPPSRSFRHTAQAGSPSMIQPLATSHSRPILAWVREQPDVRRRVEASRVSASLG
jgi:hypothetical protein